MNAAAELARRGRERLAALGLAECDLGPPGALARAVGYSDFLHGLCLRLGADGGRALMREAARAPHRSDFARLAREVAAAAAVERGLALIALRDLAGLAPVRVTLLATSLLAEAVLAQVLQGEAEASRLVVFGLGKLGGRELNFYSDLDLVFAASAAADERDELAAVRAVQRVLARMEGGFRIDLRLRPFGQSGPLIMGLAAMEAYFQNHGREWERYAWIKARTIAGNRAAGRAFLIRLRPFVYRRYLDYHAIEGLREMKRRIAEEAGESARDVKRGPGGIREVEFVVQVFQLVRAGRTPALVGSRLKAALSAAVRFGLLSAGEGEALGAAYRFLRTVENRLQMQNLTPNHRLPDDPEQRSRLAGSLGYPDWTAFARDLDGHRDLVKRTFAAVFGAPRRGPVRRGLGEHLWNTAGEVEEQRELLRGLGFRDAEAGRGNLASFRSSRAVRLMSVRGRNALDRVMPRMLEQLAAFSDPDAALLRLLRFVAALVGRSPYLALLAERPQTLARVVTLAGASEWMAQRLAAAPVVLDEILDPRLDEPPTRRRLAGEFTRAVLASDEPDLATERLREVNETQRVKIAAAFSEGRLSPDETEGSLTLLAELSVRAAFALAVRHMRARHGLLRSRLLAVAYGKLGSCELGFASDLDLVFLYRSEAAASSRGLAADTYVARQAQRVISLLALPTAAGALYTVDTRLRPEGTAGLLLSRFEGWRQYQRDQARPWEHQALLKARAVAGSTTLARCFAMERRELLTGSRSRATLSREIVAMRARVAAGGPARSANGSALLDGEFLAAYWLLAGARACPAAVRPTRTADQLAALAACGAVPGAQELAPLLTALRAGLNRTELGLPADEPTESASRARIRRLWREQLNPAGSPL